MQTLRGAGAGAEPGAHAGVSRGRASAATAKLPQSAEPRLWSLVTTHRSVDFEAASGEDAALWHATFSLLLSEQGLLQRTLMALVAQGRFVPPAYEGSP